ncbi:MAG: hypothetical protein U9N49_06670 [Campylobacterota bacterium]|nr:hypothetical protein [Campylobacterota bacterium]
MKKFKLALMAMIISAFTSCGSTTDTMETTNENVTVSPCQSDVNNRTSALGNPINNNYTYVEHEYRDNALWLTHYNAVFNCDERGINATASINGNQLTITQEQNLPQDGGMNCLCLYDITIKVEDIEDKAYTVHYDDGVSEDMNFNIYHYEYPGIRSFARNEYPYLNIEDKISNIVIYRTSTINKLEYGSKVISTQTELDNEIKRLEESEIRDSMDSSQGLPLITTILQNSDIDFTQESLVIYAFLEGGICEYNENITLISDTQVDITLSKPFFDRTPCTESSTVYYLAYKVSKDIGVVGIQAFHHEYEEIKMK